MAKETFQKFETFGKLPLPDSSASSSPISLAAIHSLLTNYIAEKAACFNPNFKAKRVLSEAYYTQLILYIHQNPVKHCFATDSFDWPFSSIHHYTSGNGSLLPNRKNIISDHTKEEVIGWFGGFDKMVDDHKRIWEIRSVFE